MTATLGLALAPSVSDAAACVPQTGNEITVDPGGGAEGWCVAGALPSGVEHSVYATTATPGLWQLELEALPGQTGVVVLIGDGAPLWEGRLSGDGTAASPPLLLGAGSYRIALATTEGMMIYRVRLLPAAPLPPGPPPGIAGAFAATLAANGELALAWTVDPAPVGTLWSIAAQAPLGGYLDLTLRDEAGSVVGWTNLPDASGIYRLPDLALAPGAYRILVSGPPPEAPVIVSATADIRPPGFAVEPDGLPEQAHAIGVGRPATGRLATGGPGADTDFFVLDIAPGTPVRLYDVSVTAAADAQLRLALTDGEGTPLSERAGSRQIHLRAIALGPGRNVFRVSGSLTADDLYTLLVEEAGETVAGAEIEPNDIAPRATPLPASGPVFGTFAGTDQDYIDLGVAGEIQLWTIEAVGEGLAAFTLYDGADQIIATTAPSPGTHVARVSRILLPPGRNIVRLDGTDGTWLLRATPLGPPLPGEEIEPNDDPSRALALVAGLPQTGWLDRPGDADLYSFHLAAPHRVRLTLTGPDGFPLVAAIGWGEVTNRIVRAVSGGIDGAPQRLVWDGLLPAGDFVLEVWTDGGASRDPYSLTLDFPAFHDRPADLEPNNEPWQATPLAAGRPAEGTIQGDDADWFALDPALGPGTLTISAVALTGPVQVQVARGDLSAPEYLTGTYLFAAGETLTVELSDRSAHFVRIDGGAGRYVIAVGPAVAAAGRTEATAALAFDATIVAAFGADAQRIAGTLHIQSKARAALTLRPSAWIGDERWGLEGVPAEIVVPPGGRVEVPVALLIPADTPDGAPIGVEVALVAETAAPTIARATIAAAAGVPLVGARPHLPLPPELLGGLNVAWAVLGGEIDDPAQAGLIDDVVGIAGVTLYGPAVVRLAGGTRPIPIAGVVLELPPGGSPSDRLAGFAVELSADGATFQRVLEARLSSAAGEQAFPFPGVRLAVAVRLVPLSVQSDSPFGQPLLAEFAVIAEPGHILDPAGFDIGLPALGGHIVRQAGIPDHVLTGEAAAWPGGYAIALAAERVAAPEWVLGFLDSRAASITSVIWYPRPDIVAEEQIAAVEVAVSIAGPLGPFITLGTFAVDPLAPTAIPFAEPVWARALRFAVVAPEAATAHLPDRIEVREAPGPSILGAWGDFSRRGPYEAQLPPPAEAIAGGPTASTDRTAPTALALEAIAAGQVRRGATDHWYSIDLPDGALSLRASFPNALATDVALTLVGEDGREIALVPDPAAPGNLSAPAGPGRWLLRVAQPTASVAVAWDTSFSVATFYPSIARMVRQLGNDLDEAREQINLLPFRGDDGRFLMDSWSGDRGAIYAALHAYPLRDASSDAETALLFAAEQLSLRVGSRAIVVITDGAYSGVYKNEALWRNLELGGVRVFALHLPVDDDPARVRAQRNLLSDWAASGAGHVARFASQADSEVAFRRVAAWLAQPADYSFTLAAETTPPEPGLLRVTLAAPDADAPAVPGAAAAAMAIILDASGSMLQRLGDLRRIDIAKDVLRTLGAEMLPDGLPVALRVFGNDQPDSCEQELLLPLAPLDRDAFVAAVERVQSVNLARTPIAASLRAAAGDLATSGGSRLIVLVTDGEETCGGDPLAEIAALRAGGFEVRINIVGFAIDDLATRQVLEAWAAAGGGAYFEAGDQDALRAAVGAATGIAFVVLDSLGEEVATGLVGGDPVALRPGIYRVRVGTEGQVRDIVIQAGQRHEVTFGPG